MRKVLSFVIILILILSFSTIAFAGTVESDVDMGFIDFILGENIQFVFVLLVVGAIIKKYTPIDNKFIPLILICISVIFVGVTMYYNELPNPSMIGLFIIRALTQSIFVTGAAIFGHQIVKQLKQ